LRSPGPPHDVVVVGGGIVGLAVAHAVLERRPGASVVVLEKEASPGRHQTGRNSGVIHSGVYYRPGSLKARLAVAGNASMVAFAREHGIAHTVCGKLIVATDDLEAAALPGLAARAGANGIATTLLGGREAAEVEPHVRAVAALQVPSTGVVDYGEVAAVLAAEVGRRGGTVLTGHRVDGLARVAGGWEARTPGAALRSRLLVTCGGLHSDRLARMAGADPGARIVPFRGEYQDLRPGARHLVRGLVYPVPDPRVPFLGVHLTRGVHGDVHAGPNAVLALAREGYRWRDVSARDLAGTLADPGFRRLARRHWRTGLGEMHRSLRRTRFVEALRRLVPELTVADLSPAPSGVRAQAVDARGDLLDDFRLVDAAGAVHVVNAPSPAATAALEIGRLVAARLLDGAGRRDPGPQ
jgi:(S)-2-hydroxyglutarate dehydrogenase